MIPEGNRPPRKINQKKKQNDPGFPRDPPRPTPGQDFHNEQGDEVRKKDLRDVTQAWYSYYRKLKNFRKKYKLKRRDSKGVIYTDNRDFTPNPVEERGSVASPLTNSPPNPTTPKSLGEMAYYATNYEKKRYEFAVFF